MGKSDKIEAFILELLRREEEEWLKIQRNELAHILGCVPSQINYVISTRFSPERGYQVETRRGGGGCVMIKRKNLPVIINNLLTHDECRALLNGLHSRDMVTRREVRIIEAMTELLNDHDRAVLVKRALDTVL